MTLHLRAKVILHVWSYNFNDTTLSTATYMQRHMINFSFVSGLRGTRLRSYKNWITIYNGQEKRLLFTSLV